MASVDLAVSVFDLKKYPSKTPSITLRATVLKKAVGDRSLSLLVEDSGGSAVCLGCHYRKPVLDDLNCGRGFAHRLAIGIQQHGGIRLNC